MTRFNLVVSVSNILLPNSTFDWIIKCENNCSFKKGDVGKFSTSLRITDIPFYLISGIKTNMYFEIVVERETNSTLDEVFALIKPYKTLACANLPVIIWKA